ncbi:MAG: TerB family tellurite resistance protein [Burkholderiales bacterium]
MRSYPRNSPEAAARILAVTMICDGHLDKREMEAMRDSRAIREIEVDETQWHDVMRGVCEDLLVAADMHWDRACRIDQDTLDGLLAEIDDPALARRVLAACHRAASADRTHTDAELVILRRAERAWGLDVAGVAAR